MSFLLRSGANFEGFLALMPVHAGIPALMACLHLLSCHPYIMSSPMEYSY